ncbi:hypothetical protein G5V59_09020 [Nocardioides sp. W3-2-3]|uniref:hypothetical protein n=1 Tax=Nocardioides convexus TaxID=2712224 RepID=UPI002418AAA3|nr:hypothetical protein [Nocardioides convexus]NHA00227.1 hypothetical protein [Nocardioides convexus]
MSTIRRTPSTATIQIMSLEHHVPGRGQRADRRGQPRRARAGADGRRQPQQGRPEPGLHPSGQGPARGQPRQEREPSRRPATAYAKTCQGSCRRGNAASAHAKYYMFSKVGATRNVVMQGSANLTAAAASNQWNDLVTYTDNAPLYGFFNTTFVQMWQDRYVSPSWRQFKGSTYEMYFSPRLNGDVDPLTYQAPARALHRHDRRPQRAHRDPGGSRRLPRHLGHDRGQAPAQGCGTRVATSRSATPSSAWT